MIRTVKDKDNNEYLVVDLDKKEVIRGVQWANDKNGEIIRKYCKITLGYEYVIEEKKGNIIFVKTNGITNSEITKIKNLLHISKTFKISYSKGFELLEDELIRILEECFGKDNIKVKEIK